MNSNNNNGESSQQLLLPTHLDPTVAALLQTDPNAEDMSPSSIRIVIAHMKLQQARVRGNSDYAAKVMDEAIAEGARDKEAWTLLSARIAELEEHIATTATDNTADSNTDSATAAQDDDAEGDNSKNENKDDEVANKKDDATTDDPAKVTELEQQLHQEQERATTMERILSEHLQQEIDHVKTEQVSLREREHQLRERIRSLQIALQSWPESAVTKNNNTQKSTHTENNNNKKKNDTTKDNGGDENVKNHDDEKNNIDTAVETATAASVGKPIIITKQSLQDQLQEIHEEQATLLKTQCTICHENTATRAVIPCGHLCLCDDCTSIMTKSVSSAEHAISSTAAAAVERQCPLCRGHLLSTLHIYTSK